jgi:hypothetical protein
MVNIGHPGRLFCKAERELKAVWAGAATPQQTTQRRS